jgi:4-hydroxyphenylpyruvate dioxygenase
MNYEKPKERPQIGKFFGFDHIKFWVGNSKQAASFYTSRFGFEYLAYQGLETKSRETACHVVKRNDIIFAFESSYDPEDKNGIGMHVLKHGDGVRDIAFTVEDCETTFELAKKRGAKVVRNIEKLKDEDGEIIIASILAYNDTIHTFVERKNYKGLFMPGFVKHHETEAFNNEENELKLNFIDHVVSNHPEGEMEVKANWYETVLDFHRFWSVDDSIMHTEYSALNSIVVADYDENIKMPINEPAKGKKKSQIQEYCDYYNGSGVQHIALNTDDIIESIQKLRKRGVQFLNIPKTYYDNLRKKIPSMNIKIKEDIDKLEELRILIDYDDNGYLLQLFTKPLEDRPTLFFEIIQRRNHQGFGAGNFKALFRAIELDQELRGNLVDIK